MSVEIEQADRHLWPRLRAAEARGYLEEPDEERLRCGCGYSGRPLCIVRHSEWSESPGDYDLFVCPECGDA